MTARLEQLWPLFLVSDMDASLAFYRDGLGFRVVGAAEREGSIFWCRLERGGGVTVPEPDGRTIVFESPTEAWTD